MRCPAVIEAASALVVFFAVFQVYAQTEKIVCELRGNIGDICPPCDPPKQPFCKPGTGNSYNGTCECSYPCEDGNTSDCDDCNILLEEKVCTIVPFTNITMCQCANLCVGLLGCPESMDTFCQTGGYLAKCTGLLGYCECSKCTTDADCASFNCDYDDATKTCGGEDENDAGKCRCN